MRIDLFFIPTILAGIIIYAMFHHVNLFESFFKRGKRRGFYCGWTYPYYGRSIGG